VSFTSRLTSAYLVAHPRSRVGGGKAAPDGRGSSEVAGDFRWFDLPSLSSNFRIPGRLPNQSGQHLVVPPLVFALLTDSSGDRPILPRWW
jgi:hypothetical protein